VVLLEAWKSFEEEQGSSEDVQKVQEMMPKVMKKWRQAEDGSGLEECESPDPY
jgi:crooked neck